MSLPQIQLALDERARCDAGDALLQLQVAGAAALLARPVKEAAKAYKQLSAELQKEI